MSEIVKLDEIEVCASPELDDNSTECPKKKESISGPGFGDWATGVENALDYLKNGNGIAEASKIYEDYLLLKRKFIINKHYYKDLRNKYNIVRTILLNSLVLGHKKIKIGTFINLNMFNKDDIQEFVKILESKKISKYSLFWKRSFKCKAMYIQEIIMEQKKQ